MLCVRVWRGEGVSEDMEGGCEQGHGGRVGMKVQREGKCKCEGVGTCGYERREGVRV
jgi:hypothetical protein